MSTPPTSSRPPAPDVAPVEHNGVRYEEDRTDERQGDQAGGYLVALDAKSGARLWRLKVYEVPDYRSAGVSAGGIYFRSMRLAPGGGALEIENEAGGKYLVDIARRTSTQVGGPQATGVAKPAPPPKPKPQ
jgi:PQQ enzyme-like repeat protein